MRYFNLFSNILITKGASRILISDLQRNTSELYPLELCDLIAELNKSSIEEVLTLYDNESKIIIQQYLDSLLEKEYGFITSGDWDKNFIPMSLEYHDNSTISNLFIEIDGLSVLQKIKSSIEKLEIKYLTIFSYKNLSYEDFLKIEQYFKASPVEGIDILSPYHPSIDQSFIQKINSEVFRIYNLTFYNCKEKMSIPNDDYHFTVNFTVEKLTVNSCGKVNMDYFNTNITKVLEAINYNSCLYKKIGIDLEGNIKNCPAMPKVFGNVKISSLEDALKHSEFREYWNLSKDHIETCKDCEFRYICTDCRAYTERAFKNDKGLDCSKPLKCGYNPYSGEWEEWSTNKLKQKAINHYKILVTK
ncbi:grasp-with-spasm system SPASM domain peptide maturase [Elizabethkingia meningoseptica]|uniref:grasp-with-spasm system SPASM domain peptide maturase n=1 Tax=Elizabethkingia meningoseptica TaxID=238 RepID=UPI0023B1CFDD|nr:grasp-with-spasm system SPASM domain peptide maturase [Elizabethkingia meningoseptica]MDE5510619.1 grasp-with-spasm system SPASM domain peptide maturase [Elizabethkingia meningoseptica]